MASHPDNPTEYIARLEDDQRRLQAEVQRLQAEVQRLEDEVISLRASLNTSDALRAGLHDATVQAAQVAEAAIDRLIRATKRDEAVVQAAYAVVSALIKGAPAAEGERLSGELVDAVIAHQAGAPS